ncbi:MAG TPA: hypothetical protein VFD07_03280 [Candidatus Krumholzibacteria bacterium]|nr:hypothetical protein [Candidatus Krumholzibacteria bacterium]
MRRRIAGILTLATSLFVLSVATASAQVDVELAFTPETASPGQKVTLFASIANLSSEPVQADFTVAIALGSMSTGAIPFVLPLAAGLERSAEIPFIVPPVMLRGVLTITVSATAGGQTDTAVATLTLVNGSFKTTDETTLRQLGTSVGMALTGSAGSTPTDDTSMSDVKRLYR